MWITVDFPLSSTAEDRLFGESGRSSKAFRKKLAAMSTAHGMGLPPQFFGYAADGAANDEGETAISIGVYARGLRLRAIGSSACELLQRVTPVIHSALIGACAELIPMHTSSGEHGLDFLPFARRMFIHDLCVGKSSPGNYWYAAAKSAREGRDWMDLGERKIPNYLVQSIMSQALLLDRDGDDVSGDLGALIGECGSIRGSWSPAHSKLKHLLQIKLLSVGGQSWLKRDHGCSLVRLHDVEFSMHAKLTGPWFAGRMKIEGRGQIMESSRWREDANQLVAELADGQTGESVSKSVEVAA